jgi:hypothetical protein
MNSIFDYELLETQINDESGLYLRRSPYPFTYFDGLFNQALIDEVNREIDDSNFKKDGRSIDGIEVKVRSNFEDNESLPPQTKKIFDVLNGGKFLNLVSRLTGIDGLISDPYYDGGGINIIENNGTLAVHVDGTNQHRMKVCRRLNAILFVNEHWDESWNGYHEQWTFNNKELSPFDDKQSWRCVRKILPKKNRLLLFTTNDHSWHGHAGVLNVPPEVQRRSLITYYYTATRPDSDVVFGSPHRALFIDNKITLTDSAYEDVEVIL